jgi:hypothetical protein
MKRVLRGSTLVETLIASALLLLGMVGVVQLILAGMNQNGMANARATGQDLASAGAAAAASLPFDAVSIGVFDGGIVFDSDGRRFGSRRTVTDIGDGGTRARQVVVSTEWRDFVGALSWLRTAQVSVIVSEIPDAGP